MANNSSAKPGNSTRFVQVCVYQDTNFGGQYAEQSKEAKDVGPLPHAQNFTWGESYLPDRGTVCAIPTEAPTMTPTPTPTQQIVLAVTAIPTATLQPTILPPALSITAVPTIVPTQKPTATPLPTETPTPTDVPLPPPAQLPLTDYPK